MISSDISNNAPVLALCCAEEELLVTVGSSADDMRSESIICPGQSIQHLHPIIQRLLAAYGAKPKDLRGIACVSGPGSFTGLRIAHACMYGLAFPHALPMAGMSYHALLASQAPNSDQPLWVLTYARRGQVYAQKFQKDSACSDISVYPAQSVLPLLIAEERLAIMGSGVRKNPELSQLPHAEVLPSCLDVPSPATLLGAALCSSFSHSAPVPVYLRKSDAEDNLPTIAASRGISEAAARSTIHDYR